MSGDLWEHGGRRRPDYRQPACRRPLQLVLIHPVAAPRRLGRRTRRPEALKVWTRRRGLGAPRARPAPDRPEASIQDPVRAGVRWHPVLPRLRYRRRQFLKGLSAATMTDDA